MSKWKETADKESKAKDAVARDFSMQMNELLASLDTFKLNNQKSVLDKERELEELKEKFTDATTKVRFTLFIELCMYEEESLYLHCPELLDTILYVHSPYNL